MSGIGRGTEPEAHHYQMADAAVEAESTFVAGGAVGCQAPARGLSSRRVVRVMVNGEPRALDAGVTVADLVAALGLGPRRVAVEVNRAVVPRAEDRKSTRLNSSHVANSYAVFRLKKKTADGRLHLRTE